MNDELTHEIIAAAYKVHKTLGFGYLEKVYENAMMIELRKRNISAIQQLPVVVYYEGEIVGDYRADIMVEDRVLIELKSNVELIEKDEVQLVNYLKGTNKPYGLLINFGTSVTVKRKYKDYRPPRNLKSWLAGLVNFLPF